MSEKYQHIRIRLELLKQFDNYDFQYVRKAIMELIAQSNAHSLRMEYGVKGCVHVVKTSVMCLQDVALLFTVHSILLVVFFSKKNIVYHF